MAEYLGLVGVVSGSSWVTGGSAFFTRRSQLMW